MRPTIIMNTPQRQHLTDRNEIFPNVIAFLEFIKNVANDGEFQRYIRICYTQVYDELLSICNALRKPFSYNKDCIYGCESIITLVEKIQQDIIECTPDMTDDNRLYDIITTIHGYRYLIMAGINQYERYNIIPDYEYTAQYINVKCAVNDLCVYCYNNIQRTDKSQELFYELYLANLFPITSFC